MVQLNIDKSKLEDYKLARREILREIKPQAKQTADEEEFINSIIHKISKMPGKHLSAIVAGSFGKGTNLANTKDFDVFVLYPKDMKREEFVEEGLAIGQAVFKGYFWEKAYSEHPYIRGVIDNYKVEIVPAYKIAPGEDIISSVDRTSLHLLFVLKNMKATQKDEVRILKQFMKAIDCYGADSEVFGFSGYLCELLILFYGDFITLLTHAANFETPIKFTLVKDQEVNLARFNDPLVVIDPVDQNRNVAAAVSDKQLSMFIAASRAFLQHPTKEFFNKKPSKQITYHQMVGLLDNFALTIVQFDVKDMLKEVVWSKVRKNSKKIISHLEFSDFNILKNDIFYKEGDNKCYLIILTETLILPRYKQAIGPPVCDMKNSQNYLDNTKAMLGPYIKDYRWYSIKQREMTDMKTVLLSFLPENSELDTDIFVGQDIRNLYLVKTEVLEFLSDFFIPKERFLI